VAFSTVKRRRPEMNLATHGTEGSASAPVLYMAGVERQDLEVGVQRWCQTPAGIGAGCGSDEALAGGGQGEGALRDAGYARVVSCYEAGRDGFWLQRHLRSVGIENEVLDAASIEVSRRLRHVKTDRLDRDRLLAKLIRHHAGERCGWSLLKIKRALGAPP
jgi:hypothetical protein